MKVPRIDLSAPPYIGNMINSECAYTDIYIYICNIIAVTFFNHSDPYLSIFLHRFNFN